MMSHLFRTFVGMILVSAVLAGSLDGAVAPGPSRAAPKSGAGATQPAAPVVVKAAADLKAELLAAAAEGKLTAALLKLFRDYAAASVRERYVPKAISKDLWDWILANQDLREAVLVGLHPENDRDLAVLGRLAVLRKKFGDRLRDYPHLAMAFAIVYGYAGTKSIREGRLRYVEKDRKVPSMVESFGYYLKNEKTMKMSLKTTPWPVLVYVADNDLPLAERRWAVARYGARPPMTYASLYYDVPYDHSAVGEEKKGKLGSRPRTLANILSCGGVCAHRGYYASRVCKSLGVPSLYDCGSGARGGHAWVAWVGRQGKTVDLLFTGRFDFDRYYTGTVFDPVTRKYVLDRDVQLDVAAMLRSYPGYLNAIAACRTYAMLDDQKRAKATGLLDGAIRQNPYCSVSWRMMAADCAKGVIPAKRGEVMYAKMMKAFAAYPDLTFRVLAMILEPRFSPDTKPTDREITANLQILGGAHGLYVRSQRPDLAVKLRYLQGQYLEANGRKEQATKLYVMASEKYATEHFGFVRLYDRAIRLLKEDGKTALMLKYMNMVAEKVPKFQGVDDFNRRHNLINPTYKHVVMKYAAALTAAGRAAEAKTWSARLDKAKG